MKVWRYLRIFCIENSAVDVSSVSLLDRDVVGQMLVKARLLSMFISLIVDQGRMKDKQERQCLEQS